jgi:uncharacterized protein YbjT (DUF2867 family)
MSEFGLWNVSVIRRFMLSMTDQAPILVTGGTGKTGRRVARLLEQRGVPARIGSRSGQPPFDWDNRSTWAPALDGVRGVYISFQPDLAVPGATETVAAFAEQALSQGVQRLVLISGRGEEEAQRAELAVRAVAPGVTIERASWFSQNFSEDFLIEDVLAGTVALPVDGVREPFVDADDIAEIAVAALIEERHAGELYEVTGPRLLTFADAVAEIAQATGRELRFVAVRPEDYRAALDAQGLPPEVAGLVLYLFREVLDGRNEQLTDGVRRALGREPRDFRAYAQATARTGVWDA